MYDIEIRLSSKNGYHTPAEALAYYGRYSRQGFTVHWWNSPDRIADSDHDNIVNMKLGQSTRGEASVNYVLSNNKITLMVSPDNVAWCSQNGNPTTISCEFSPHLNDEGYKKAGWLISELEDRYGKTLQLYRHSDWFSTACPGTLDVNRMRAEADKWKSGGYKPAPPLPQPVPTPAPPVPAKPVVDGWTLWKEGAIQYTCNKQPTHLWDFNNKTWNMKSVKEFNKGDIITIIGHATNTALKKDYYITQYSFEKKIANGFNPADLDIYVAPRPTPTPPIVPAPIPTPPTKDEEQDQRLNALERAVKAIVDFLKGIFTNFKG